MSVLIASVIITNITQTFASVGVNGDNLCKRVNYKTKFLTTDMPLWTYDIVQIIISIHFK